MSGVSKNTSDEVIPQPDDRKPSPDERAAGRARIAQLLGQLIYKRWRLDREHDKEQKPKSKGSIAR